MRVQYPFLYGTEWLRQQIEISDERRVLGWIRDGRDLCYEPEPDPLVTVRVATYGRGRTVVDRAVRSAVEQTYENLEILVIGDRCDRDTVEAMAEVRDERVRFLNLAERGNYPPLAHHRRKVAGAHPMNVGNLLARGRWIAPCDDDDELTADAIEVRLAACRERRLEMVYSKAEDETEPGIWTSVGRPPLARSDVSHGSVMFRSELRFMPYSMTCWKMREPSDWNLWKRMDRIGVRTGFVDHVSYRHHLSEAGRTRLASGDTATSTGATPTTSTAT
jgi:glycosyltransferase involved in cell wall biosynthesis